MKCEAVIFDWAGTTVDYGCFAPVQAFMEIFRAYGIEPTMEETRSPMGMLKWDHIKTMLQMERIGKEFRRIHGRDFTDADVDAMHNRFQEMLLGILDRFSDPKDPAYGASLSVYDIPEYGNAPGRVRKKCDQSGRYHF